MLEDVLTQRQRILGDNHPDTLMVALHLVIGLESCGQIFPARALIDDILKRLRRTLGAEHPATKDALETKNRIVALLGGASRAKGSRSKRAGRR
jgi:hypothetical protein